MGTWNHRVMRHAAGTDNEYLAIHEVYYDNEDGKEKLGWTQNPISVSGENLDELRWVLERMLRALDHPILEYKDEEDMDEGTS